ncbi:Hypothetical protein PACV_177 [Pacmanvirus A23]|uniref:Hypothetical protein n=1 Tax=Pacmanvirus A23 TaxID=1932881 RepID=UPI000A091E12|nr:Hypothetical protein B9W72_gp175 [Pacmanvirus A23]SIP85892.1 Hypothetical protein PACV_177 [Pacmanvirus A23]
MAQVVAVAVSEAVNGVATAIGTVASSDTKSAENISSALKIGISNISSVPKNASEIAMDLEKQIVSRGGKLTDNVGSAIKVLSQDIYNDIQHDPEGVKKIGKKYIDAIDVAFAGAKRDIHAVKETAKDLRGAITDSAIGTLTLPLDIGVGVFGKIKNTIFGSAENIDTTKDATKDKSNDIPVVTSKLTIVLLIIVCILIILFIYFEFVKKSPYLYSVV